MFAIALNLKHCLPSRLGTKTLIFMANRCVVVYFAWQRLSQI